MKEKLESKREENEEFEKSKKKTKKKNFREKKMEELLGDVSLLFYKRYTLNIDAYCGTNFVITGRRT